MRWTATLLVPVVAASCATSDDGGGRLGDALVADRDAPSGGGRVEHLDGLDLSLAVPADWVTIDTELLTDPSAGTEELDELAGGLGVDPDAITELIDDTVVLSVVAPSDSPAPANLNVMELPVPGGLPPRAMLEAGLAAAGAEVLDVEVTERDGMAMVEIRYRLDVEGVDRTLEGVSVFLEVDDVALSVTVSSTDRAEADRVGDLVVATLEPTG